MSHDQRWEKLSDAARMALKLDPAHREQLVVLTVCFLTLLDPILWPFSPVGACLCLRPFPK